MERQLPTCVSLAEERLGDEAFSLCHACLLLGTLLVPLITQVFSWAPLRFFGKVSYSIYLWHAIGLSFSLTFSRGAFDRFAVAVLLFAILVWGMAAYVLVERPFLRLQGRFRPG